MSERNGADVWRASCPVHRGGKDRNLKVTHTQDGAYIAYCFVCGCNQNDVARDYAFPLVSYTQTTKKKRQLNLSTLTVTIVAKEQMRFDRMVIEQYERTREPTLADRNVYKLSLARFKRYNEKMQDWMGL